MVSSFSKTRLSHIIDYPFPYHNAKICPDFFPHYTVNPMIDFSSPDGGVYVVNEMFPIVFMCNATGIPTPEIQWRRGSMILDPADNSTFAGRLELSSPSVDEPERSVSSTTRTLTVNNTMEGDAGGYSCVATNDAAVGRDDANFQLFVQGKC